MAQKQVQPLRFPASLSTRAGPPGAERMESRDPGGRRLPSALLSRAPRGPGRHRAHRHALPPLAGPALGQPPGESLRDEDATARRNALPALVARSAQRPGAGQSLTPCRLPSRTGLCE